MKQKRHYTRPSTEVLLLKTESPILTESADWFFGQTNSGMDNDSTHIV